MKANNSLPVLTATIFALLGDMSGYVASLTEKRELFEDVPGHTLGVPTPADAAVPIRSDQIPEGSPPAFTRGVRWDPCTPAGYRTLIAHNADGVLVMLHMVREELLDPDLVDRAWTWLDRQCPEMSPNGEIPEPQLSRPRLLA
jgi:hypothetical protein